MECVYEAENALQAHMIVGLLAQANVHAWVQGDLLQGGVGEIQAMGFVRVLTADNDMPAALACIEDWKQHLAEVNEDELLDDMLSQQANNDPIADHAKQPESPPALGVMRFLMIIILIVFVVVMFN